MITETARSAPIRFGSRVQPPQPGTRPRKTSGSEKAGSAAGDRAVGAVQADLDAAAHRRAVVVREGRHREAGEALEDVVAALADGERVLVVLQQFDALEVGADGEDERLAGDADAGDLAVRGLLLDLVDRRVQVGQRLGAEGGRLGVVEAVVQRDQREAAGALGRSRWRTCAWVTTSSGNSSAAPFSSSAVVVLTWCLRRREVRVLPDDRAAHAEADAHGGEAVADVRLLLELAGQLGHQPHPGGGQRVAEGDGAAVLVDPRVVVGDAVVVEQGQHLDGEGLVDLEQADVVDAQARLGERLLGRRDRADSPSPRARRRRRSRRPGAS